jgi:hypothetical protein
MIPPGFACIVATYTIPEEAARETMKRARVTMERL